MSIPITGVLLIPLGLILTFLPWRYCLIGLMTFAMLSPAAVVNVGSFGLQPGYYLAILLIGRTLGEVMLNRFTLNGFVISRMLPLWWFTVTAFAVLFIALCFFQGTVAVLPGTSGFKSAMSHPFHLARENFTQIAYLLVNVFLVYSLAHNGARQRAGALVSAWDVALACGLCFAAGVCFWQFASLYAGVPFPNDFFYSNAGYSRADSQSMVGLFRINGPFEEPSTLGYTFSGYLLYAWARYRNHPTALTIGMIAACIFCMLVSTSTTALVGVAMFVCLVIYDATTGRVALLPKSFRMSPSRLVVIGVISIAIIVGAFVVAANWAAINIILKNVLFNKAESTSFQQRSFADYLALQIFTQTYGIGVGLGSHKANSLLLTLLSNTGVVGVVLFCWFLFVLFLSKRAAKMAPLPDIRPFQLCLMGLLVIHLISNPNLSVMTLWLMIGALLAFQAAERKQITVAKAPLEIGLGRQELLAARRIAV